MLSIDSCENYFLGAESMNHELLTKSIPCKSTSSHVVCLLRERYIY